LNTASKVKQPQADESKVISKPGHAKAVQAKQQQQRINSPPIIKTSTQNDRPNGEQKHAKPDNIMKPINTAVKNNSTQSVTSDMPPSSKTGNMIMNNITVAAPSQTNPASKLQPPPTVHKPLPPKSKMLYVGITLEKSKAVPSWGIVFTKEKTNHAQINRVTVPTMENGGPTIKWCRVTQTAPHPALVYRAMTAPIIPLDQYETNMENYFPSACDKSSVTDVNILSSYLLPGDAIIAINGISVSSFSNTPQFAAYIRANCQRKMCILALRHEYVKKTHNDVITRVQAHNLKAQNIAQPISIEDETTRISIAVKCAWIKVTGGPSSAVVKRKSTSSMNSNVKKVRIVYTNDAFQDEKGNPIVYCDNSDSENEYDPDDGRRIRGFLNNEIDVSFHQWLQKRKATWRQARPRKYVSHTIDSLENEDLEGELTVQHDFWLASGYQTFDQWLAASKTKWARTYSWHQERKNALQLDCEREVHLNSNISQYQFENWLGVRKQQWRLERRKRQRLLGKESSFAEQDDSMKVAGDDGLIAKEESTTTTPRAMSTNEDMYIDEILENEERLTSEETATLEPMDITWLFDSSLGAPDDVVVNIMRFLKPSDHGNLLCLSYVSNYNFKLRQEMWKTLCPSHWILPRRPRKSWAALYITKIRAEEEASRKRSDDILVKAHLIIDKADQLNKFQKLIAKAEKTFQFGVNYTSGVVLERNSLLNLAIIEKRHKISKWLIEEKGADIESCDRGSFTPLMNAAWAGDKHMVRYLLAKGCCRVKVGFNHSSKGLAASTFKGLTAEGWARKRGHDGVAELIRLGL